MDSSSTSTGVIGTDSVIISYPERKVILGQGSFGVVFATRLGRARLAVKIVHCGKHWRRHHEKLETEVMPLTMSARNCWKHVTSANRAFVHENRASDLAQLLKNGNIDGSPFAPSKRTFCPLVPVQQVPQPQAAHPQPQQWQQQPMSWSSSPGVDQAQA